MMRIAVLVMVAHVLAIVVSNPVQIGNCRNSEECGPGSCCVVGMDRYSMPWCRPMRQLGEMCRPASTQPTNMTLSYPSGVTISVFNAHEIMCPCGPNLQCDTHEGICTSALRMDNAELNSSEEETKVNEV